MTSAAMASYVSTNYSHTFGDSTDGAQHRACLEQDSNTEYREAVTGAECNSHNFSVDITVAIVTHG